MCLEELKKEYEKMQQVYGNQSLKSIMVDVIKIQIFASFL